jgi:hypothetical protein
MRSGACANWSHARRNRRCPPESCSNRIRFAYTNKSNETKCITPGVNAYFDRRSRIAGERVAGGRCARLGYWPCYRKLKRLDTSLFAATQR